MDGRGVSLLSTGRQNRHTVQSLLPELQRIVFYPQVAHQPFDQLFQRTFCDRDGYRSVQLGLQSGNHHVVLAAQGSNDVSQGCFLGRQNVSALPENNRLAEVRDFRVQQMRLDCFWQTLFKICRIIEVSY